MPTTNAVIDLSHFNSNVDFAQVKAAGILGVFHKATQGVSFVDPAYVAHREQALANGLLWGAYHFGGGGDGVDQAGFFLDTVKPDLATLLVLDLESNPQGPSMGLEDARAFVTHVQSVTGRWPGLYAGYFLKQLLGVASDPVLGQCWFWLSQYGPTAVVPPAWAQWTMWQYTDGAAGLGPYEVPGVGRCDRDYFNGTTEELVAFWNPPIPQSGAPPATGA